MPGQRANHLRKQIENVLISNDIKRTTQALVRNGDAAVRIGDNWLVIQNGANKELRLYKITSNAAEHFVFASGSTKDAQARFFDKMVVAMGVLPS